MKGLSAARLRSLFHRTTISETFASPSPEPMPASGLLSLPLELCDEITKHLVNPGGIRWLSRLAQASRSCKVIAYRGLKQLLKPTNYLDQEPSQLTAVTRIDIWHGRDKLNDDSILAKYIAGLPHLKVLKLQTFSSTLPYLVGKLPDRHLQLHLVHISDPQQGQADAEIITALLESGKLRSLQLTLRATRFWELLVRRMIVAPPKQFTSLKLCCPQTFGKRDPPAVDPDGALVHLVIEPADVPYRNLDVRCARWLFDGADLSKLQSLHITSITRESSLGLLSKHKYPVMQELSLLLVQGLSLSDADELTSKMPLLRSSDIAVAEQ